ncbi:MAG: sulfurtransferase complex subunit TusC [Porticoccaceae bacterium]|nr:sulfurtransferase complex subunit TusC [Porticoccaceae bacterium]
MNDKRILLVCRIAPYGNSLARESLETALAAGAMGAKITLLFLDEGIWQLVGQHKPETIGHKNHAAMLSALPLYDIEQVLVDQDSVDKRNIGSAELSEIAELIDGHRVKEIFADHDVVLSF